MYTVYHVQRFNKVNAIPRNKNKVTQVTISHPINERVQEQTNFSHHITSKLSQDTRTEYSYTINTNKSFIHAHPPSIILLLADKYGSILKILISI